jgi:hypothetical protein
MLRILLAAWLGTAAAWTAAPRLGSSPAARASASTRPSMRPAPSMLLEDAQGPEALLRLCAATDRGQRCTSAERALIDSLVRDLEADAPPADATMLNGNWRLLYTSTPSVYRSSPFFWAFKQATLTLSLSLSLALAGTLSRRSTAPRPPYGRPNRQP